MKHIVDLEWDGNGQVKATEKPSGDITNYPLKNHRLFKFQRTEEVGTVKIRLFYFDRIP